MLEKNYGQHNLIPQKPAPFVRQTFTEKDINPYLSKEEYEEVKEEITIHIIRAGCLHHNQRRATIIFPGFDGGAEWGGPAVDPETGVLYVNANTMAWILQMFDVDPKKGEENFAQAGIAIV